MSTAEDALESRKETDVTGKVLTPKFRTHLKAEAFLGGLCERQHLIGWKRGTNMSIYRDRTVKIAQSKSGFAKSEVSFHFPSRTCAEIDGTLNGLSLGLVVIER